MARIREVGNGDGINVDLSERQHVFKFFDAATAYLGGIDVAVIQAAVPTEALADTEYAVRAERSVSRLFGAWRIIHIATSTLLYALLLLHIWAGYYFGFRWL